MNRQSRLFAGATAACIVVSGCSNGADSQSDEPHAGSGGSGAAVGGGSPSGGTGGTGLPSAGTGGGSGASGGTAGGSSPSGGTGGGSIPSAGTGGAEPSAGTGGAGAGAGGAAGSATGGESGGLPVPGQCEPMAQPTVLRTYEPALFSQGADPSGDPECTDVLNPDRGLFTFLNLRSLGSVSGLRDRGYTLIYGQVLIDDYRDADLDQALLDTLTGSFEQARQAGIKVLPRIYYAAGGSDPDAPLARVLSHISQLTPLFQSNADVIASLHAGFVGAWGEWHSSTNDLTEPASRQAILDALLEALPASRMVLVRRPSHKEVAYGGPLTEETAFAGDALSRIGHLNDCFLASDDDVGTYQMPGEKDYAIADSAFAAVGGETCGINPPRSECASAMAEMALHHWSFINTSYHTGVLDSWRSGGCFDTIACRLGYRFALLGHESPESVSAGEVLSLSLSVINDGYARAFNPRPVYLVLEGPERRAIPVDADPRRWAPAERVDLCLGALIPADLPAGTYTLGLWLPDESASIRDDERYAIRLSNDVTWTDGINLLDATVTVTN